MDKVKRIMILILFLMALTGCRKESISNKVPDLDEALTWFVKYESDYNVLDIQSYDEGKYILLTVFVPAGVEDYTMVRVYVINEVEGNYRIEALKDAYRAGGAGFTAELLTLEDMAILFGDIGDTIYNFDIDAIENIDFYEVTVEMSDGGEVLIPVEKNSPYICIMDVDVEVVDVVYKAENGEIRYSDYYSGPLDGSSEL